jgi:hypothetical protein
MAALEGPGKKEIEKTVEKAKDVQFCSAFKRRGRYQSNVAFDLLSPVGPKCLPNPEDFMPRRLFWPLAWIWRFWRIHA